MIDWQARLVALSEEKYADFTARLAPQIARERVLGVRVPLLRGLAAELDRTGEADSVLCQLPHTYFDENMLHALLINREKDYARCREKIDRFLPYVDNWAVCDCLSPAVFRRHKRELLPDVRRWMSSDETYTCRFGIKTLMSCFLDDAFDPALLAQPAERCGEEYYVNMAIAWFYATALAKQWEAALPYLAPGRLPEEVRRMTVRKAVESRRLTPGQKEILHTL